MDLRKRNDFSYIKSVSLLIGCCAPLLALCCGCASFGPGNEAADFTCRKLAPSMIAVNYQGHGFSTPTERTERTLLKFSEIALTNGFGFFVMLDANSGEKSELKPASVTRLRLLHRRPQKIREFFDARAIYEKLYTKYGIKSPVEMASWQNPNSLDFEFNPRLENLPVVDQTKVAFYPNFNKLRGIRFKVGRYVDLENPFNSTTALQEVVMSTAALHGATAVALGDGREIPDAEGRLIDFEVYLLVFPKARFGFDFEETERKEHKFIIRKFDPGADGPAAGLRIGDRVMAINGIDLSDYDQMMLEMIKWVAGQKITVSVVRDGQEVKIPVKTVDNSVIELP